MSEQYKLKIAGLERILPIIKIEDKLSIASFVMLGDTELNYKCSKEIIKLFPNNNFDYIVIPESKAIPLAQSICQELSQEHYKEYIVLRKSVKGYMDSPLITKVKSITTSNPQELVMNGTDREKINGKNIFLLDDVISTGESFRAMINLVRKADANICFAGAVLKEGDFDISDIENDLGLKIKYLETIPLF